MAGPRKRYTAAQQRALRAVDEVREDLRPFHGHRLDPATEQPAGLDAAERRRFRSALGLLARRVKAAVRVGLSDHPRVAIWVLTQRMLGRRRRLRGTSFEKGVRRPTRIHRDPTLELFKPLLRRGLTWRSAYQFLLGQQRIPASPRTSKPITLQEIYRRAHRDGLIRHK
jgi:hypothetical protein